MRPTVSSAIRPSNKGSSGQGQIVAQDGVPGASHVDVVGLQALKALAIWQGSSWVVECVPPLLCAPSNII